MRTARHHGDSDSLATLDGDQTRLLEPEEERRLLGELAECKAKLSEALGRIPGSERFEGDPDSRAVSRRIAAFVASNPRASARLSAIYRRYHDSRGRLAMANYRLVAHVARRFRDRGVADSDLLQEGFCGLLEAIDRFDLGHGTKLATYATWWIRQAVQRAVAAGAYPVRLSPRHLRQLAQDQEDHERPTTSQPGRDASPRPHVAAETIRRIQTATRPTVSLDASLDAEGHFRLLQTICDPGGDRIGEVEMGETLGTLMEALRPRERHVLALRFGLGGEPGLSLSQVGQVLGVSKERVRQIQDRALAKLRDLAAERGLLDALPLGA